MATIYGRNTTSGNNFWQSNVGSNNQYGYLIGSVPAGIITALDVYMAGSGGTARTVLCIWSYPSGNLLAQSSQFTAASGAGGVNGQAWQRATLTSPLVVPGPGTSAFYVGFWRNPADSAEFSFNSASGTFRPNVSAGVANVGSPGSLAVSTGSTGLMSAYLEWQAAGGYTFDGSAYQVSPAYIFDGAAWQNALGVYVFDGSAWQLVN